MHRCIALNFSFLGPASRLSYPIFVSAFILQATSFGGLIFLSILRLQSLSSFQP
ncbi:hypothetical protein [Sulfuracidifex metallicus]|uniref:hypothetical protein n=1 Tax=Sulfuracidifex metallicus TaxID=47303 RepID=UPI0012DD42B1|nr:hypothetical protein [Sulfuracidifex metallicus]WOE51611.1 hypothetical protein RQ359_000929 [Sulfuracidifex metallicus DSM 6482 = JCM 9184]